MKGRVSRRAVLAGAALLTATGAGTAGVYAATAEPAADGAPIDVLMGADGIDAPDELPSGVVSLRVRTGLPAAALLLVRLRAGESLDRYLANLAKTSSQDPEERKAATRAVEAAAESLGGAVVTGKTGATSTHVLRRGRHHLIAFEYSNPKARPVAKEVRVTEPSSRPYPHVDGPIVHRQDGARTRIELPSTRLSRRSARLVVNAANGLNEAVLAQVKPGTTEKDIRKFFDALKNGEQPPDMPLISQPVGLAPLSPGRSGVIEYELPAGEYLLFSHVIDADTGHPRAYDGTYRLTTLH